MLPLLLAANVAAAADLPSFPGAEGFGATTPGGRGGKVYFVTNLDDSGPGSFRAGCEAEGPRTVIFRVAGTIALKKPITVTHPFLTVAGQTAPGDGVCLRDAPFGIATHDVIVRYLRSRLGDVSSREDCEAMADSLMACGAPFAVVGGSKAEWAVRIMTSEA